MSNHPSIRATLRHTAFRTLLAGGTLYFVGNFMQSTAVGWMMVSGVEQEKGRRLSPAT